MIEEFDNVCSKTMSTLLDIYQMKDWGMSWAEFLEKFADTNKTSIFAPLFERKCTRGVAQSG